jgi:hypothetical protein
LKFPPIHGSFDAEAFMFENARREVGRIDEVAGLRLYAAVRTARHHFEPVGYPLRVAGSAKKRPFLIDTPAIRISSKSLKKKDGDLA